MSWDISVYAAESPPPPVEQMPHNWESLSLGSAEDVRQQIAQCFPAVDWSDPTWGILYGDQFSFEFNYGKEDPKEGFMIHVRGGGAAVEALLELADTTGWYLLDCSESEWFHHIKNPERGWEQFQAYRDKVIRTIEREI